MAAEVVTTPVFSVGERRPLFSAAQYFRGANARHYDVTPDDRRFVFAGPAVIAGGEAGGELIVVEHWFEELRRRMGN